MRRVLAVLAAAAVVAPLTACTKTIRTDMVDSTVFTPPGFEQVLFIQAGFGCDQHGQDATKAAGYLADVCAKIVARTQKLVDERNAAAQLLPGRLAGYWLLAAAGCWVLLAAAGCWRLLAAGCCCCCCCC